MFIKITIEYLFTSNDLHVYIYIFGGNTIISKIPRNTLCLVFYFKMNFFSTKFTS